MASKNGKRDGGNDYQTLPFFGSPYGNLYYGVELEIAASTEGKKCTCNLHKSFDAYYSRNSDEHWRKLVPNVVGKDWIVGGTDSSINGVSTELRTAPSSLVIHRERWKPFFAPDVIKHFKAIPSCGIHIHASKEFLSSNAELDHDIVEERVNKLGDMVTASKNQAFFKKMFGRRESQYNKYIPQKQWNQYSTAYCDKYNVVHDSEYTVEFRGFPSTTNYDTLIANIEIARALMYFAKAKNDGTLEEFKTFVLSKLHRTSCLKQHLIDKGLLNEQEEWITRAGRTAQTAAGAA